jgi:hypothetical protein
MHFDDKPAHIIIISMAIYIVLNLIENLIYYNNGKYGISTNIKTYFNLPSWKEFIFIVFIMFIFAFAQGLFTVILSKYY